MRRRKDDLDRYTEGLLKRHPEMRDEIEKADKALDIAFQIYDLRKKAGLTQTQLAKLVHTSQSNIARIEAADYTGYTWNTLAKVAKALKARVEIRVVPINSNQAVSVPHRIK